MRINPVNSFNTINRQNYSCTKPTPQSQPKFGSFYNDLDDEPSTNGYSILDLIKWFRGGKPHISKAEEEDFRMTWDPELGDISDIIDPKKSNRDVMEDFKNGKLEEQIKLAKEERARAQAKENEPPSIFNFADE